MNTLDIVANKFYKAMIELNYSYDGRSNELIVIDKIKGYYLQNMCQIIPIVDISFNEIKE